MIQEKTGSSPSPSNQVSINQVLYGSSGDDAEDDLTLAQLSMRGEVIPQLPQIQVRNRKQKGQANSSNNSRLGHGTQDGRVGRGARGGQVGRGARGGQGG